MTNNKLSEKIIMEGLTFDDVLLLPGYSEIMPQMVSLKSKLTKTLQMKIPIISAAMDTVTESATAIAIAQCGGLGIIHKNMSIKEQKSQIQQVKRSESWLIKDPVTVSSDTPVKIAMHLMSEHKISGLPVTKGKELVGIVTNRDLRFVRDYDLPIDKFMTHGKDSLVTVKPGIPLEEAKKILHKYRIEKLLCVNDSYELEGLITIKDINKSLLHPDALKDKEGRLLVGAALGVREDALARAKELVAGGADLLALDSAHGHSKNVLQLLKSIKQQHPDIPCITGNVGLAEGAKALINAGADAVKVGIGPGSICTTRIVAGVGVPQLSAIFDCAGICQEAGVPLIADGGIKYSGDIVKAIAAGADSVMIGSLLAGTDESPGEMVLYQGRSYKQYRGMGSIGAMQQGSGDRYLQENTPAYKYVPEGIEGIVPYKGSVSETVHQLAGGIRAGMGYLGMRNIKELQSEAKMLKISPASFKESHVHDIFITKEAPNYRVNKE